MKEEEEETEEEDEQEEGVGEGEEEETEEDEDGEEIEEEEMMKESEERIKKTKNQLRFQDFSSNKAQHKRVDHLPHRQTYQQMNLLRAQAGTL